ncbi:MAG: hypothetical protein Kow0099_32390 [Candidatus Abyssubacteria bacterium]
MVLALSFAVINLVFLLFCWHIIGVQADESLNIHGALRILRGERIYRDFWVYYTPGIFFLTAGAMALLGKSLFALRMTFILSASLAVAVTYLLGRKFMGRTGAIVATCLFMCVGTNLWPVSVQHWYSTFTLIFSVFLIACFLENPAHRLSLTAGGVMAGVTFLIQQQKGGMLALLASGFLLIHGLAGEKGHRRWLAVGREGAIFAGGVAAPLVVALLYFSIAGTLGDAISATIIFPLTHLPGDGGGGVMALHGSLTRVTLAEIMRFFGPPHVARAVTAVVAFIINYGAPLSVPIAALWWVISRLLRRNAPPAAILAFLAALICVASSLQRPDFHHLLSGAPPSYLAVGFLLKEIGTTDTGTLIKVRRAMSVLLISLLLLPVLCLAAAEFAYASRVERYSLGSELGFVAMIDPENGDLGIGSVIDYIRAHTEQGETIFVAYASPFIYYLSGRENPTRYPVLAMSPCVARGNVHLLDLTGGEFFDAQTRDAIASLEAAATPLIVLDMAALCLVYDVEEPYLEENLFARYLRDRFHPVMSSRGFIVMRRN